MYSKYLAAVLTCILSACGGSGKVEPPMRGPLAPQAASAPAAGTSQVFAGPLANYSVSLQAGLPSVVLRSSGTSIPVTAGVSRLVFDDAHVELTLQTHAAQAYRLYRAAFGRAPDLGGLGYHIASLERMGATLAQVSANFLASPEFQQRYGVVDNAQFVRQLYRNVLNREPETSGLEYHLNRLANGASRADILIGFSESPENQNATNSFIAHGVVFAPAMLSLSNDLAALPSIADAGNVAFLESFSEIDPCEVVPARTKYPVHFLGAWPQPGPSGARLAGGVVRGVVLKDVWEKANPVYNTGCAGDARAAFVRTVERVKAINGETIALTPWTFVDVSSSTWRIANPAELNTSTLTDDDLLWAAAYAKAAGLKVQWVNQIQGALDSSIPQVSAGNVAKFLDAFETYMLDRARLAQQASIDAMQLSCICWFNTSDPAYKATVEARMAVIAAKMKAVYQGKLFYENLDAASDASLRQQVDYGARMLFQPYVQLTAEEASNLSVDILKAKLKSAIMGMATVADLGKPTMWRIHLPSREDAFVTGYLEETFCSDRYDVISGSADACIQRFARTDFSIQAMFHEAAMQAIAEQTSFQVHSVEVDFWMTDGVMPASSFPNLATSIRGKPAEAVVKHWFARN